MIETSVFVFLRRLQFKNGKTTVRVTRQQLEKIQSEKWTKGLS